MINTIIYIIILPFWLLLDISIFYFIILDYQQLQNGWQNFK